MDIVQLGALGELVGGVAVLATLVYLAIELRHATRALQASAAQAYAAEINQANYLAARDPERARVSRLCFEDPEALTVDEREMSDWTSLGVCRTFESALLQAELGQLDRQTYEMLRTTIRNLFATDYYRSWWARNPYPFTQRFHDFIRDECGLPSQREGTS